MGLGAIAQSNLGSLSATQQGSAAGTLKGGTRLTNGGVHKQYASVLLQSTGQFVDETNLDYSYSTNQQQLKDLRDKLPTLPGLLNQQRLNRTNDILTHFNDIDTDQSGEIVDQELQAWLKGETPTDTAPVKVDNSIKADTTNEKESNDVSNSQLRDLIQQFMAMLSKLL